MQEIAYSIHRKLLKSKKTIASAESCTSGLLSFLLTRYSGSSAYYILGLITYSNKSKEKLLKIPSLIIRSKGAVSKEVAVLMAGRVRKIAETDLGVGITGIAGPSGASPRKPVGTVFIAVSGNTKTICKKFIFKGNRDNIRKQAALKALLLLKRLI